MAQSLKQWILKSERERVRERTIDFKKTGFSSPLTKISCFGRLVRKVSHQKINNIVKHCWFGISP